LEEGMAVVRTVALDAVSGTRTLADEVTRPRLM